MLKDDVQKEFWEKSDINSNGLVNKTSVYVWLYVLFTWHLCMSWSNDICVTVCTLLTCVCPARPAWNMPCSIVCADYSNHLISCVIGYQINPSFPPRLPEDLIQVEIIRSRRIIKKQRRKKNPIKSPAEQSRKKSKKIRPGFSSRPQQLVCLCFRFLSFWHAIGNYNGLLSCSRTARA